MQLVEPDGSGGFISVPNDIGRAKCLFSLVGPYHSDERFEENEPVQEVKGLHDIVYTNFSPDVGAHRHWRNN